MADLGRPLFGDDPQFVEANAHLVEKLPEFGRQDRRRQCAQFLLSRKRSFEEANADIATPDMRDALPGEVAQIVQPSRCAANQIEGIRDIIDERSCCYVLVRTHKKRAFCGQPSPCFSLLQPHPHR